MDPRYYWPPQGYNNNGQYAPPPPQQPSGYPPPNAYPMQYPPQQPVARQQQFPPPQNLQYESNMPSPSPRQNMQYMSPQTVMGGTPRYAQTLPQPKPQPQPQPHMVVQGRNILSSSPTMGFGAPDPRIRQAQMPMQGPGPVHMRGYQQMSQPHSASTGGRVRDQAPQRPQQVPMQSQGHGQGQAQGPGQVHRQGGGYVQLQRPNSGSHSVQASPRLQQVPVQGQGQALRQEGGYQQLQPPNLGSNVDDMRAPKAPQPQQALTQSWQARGQTMGTDGRRHHQPQRPNSASQGDELRRHIPPQSQQVSGRVQGHSVQQEGGPPPQQQPNNGSSGDGFRPHVSQQSQQPQAPMATPLHTLQPLRENTGQSSVESKAQQLNSSSNRDGPRGQAPSQSPQIPVQRPGQPRREDGGHQQLQRSHSGANRDGVGVHIPRPQQPQTAQAKPSQTALSVQQNTPRPQTQTPIKSNQPQAHHRPPLQQQVTPQQRMPSSHSTNTTRPHSSPHAPQTPSSQVKHPKVVIRKTTPNLAQSQPRPSPVPSKAFPTDLAVLLIHAADEYIHAARSMGSVAALMQSNEDLQQYYKLMSTGLGCIEAAYKKFNHNPRDKAKLMLRYAALLIEETDNDVEIEEVLSKGIALCSRSRLLDLKYSMQHLQARYQFKTNHRAALKSLDSPISEAETFQHIVWVYALRFLKVSLAMQVTGKPESTSALQQLHAIANHAGKRGDRAIFVTASALEAMVQLRTAGPDHVQNAQRAIAAARSYQLQASTKELGQIAALIDCVDIACSLQHGVSDQDKMKALQAKADSDPGPANGVFSVVIEKSFGGHNLTQHTGGIFTRTLDGRDELVLSWLPQEHLKMLAYYLSGLTVVAQETSRGRSYLQEGHNITQDSLKRHPCYGVSLHTSINERSWVLTLDFHLRFALGITACRADDFSAAATVIESLRHTQTQSLFKDNETLKCLTTYLTAVHAQCTGAHSSALTSYSKLRFPEHVIPTELKTDVALLAVMHRILILRSPAHAEPSQLATLTQQIEPILSSHPNALLAAAHRVLRALSAPADEAIMRQKTLTHNAISASQKLANYQLVATCLCFMADRFFSSSVGDQTIKSVRAARSIARQAKGAVWRAVALGLCVATFERCGLVKDAEEAGKALVQVVMELPKPLRDMLSLQAGGVDDQGDVQMVG